MTVFNLGATLRQGLVKRDQKFRVAGASFLEEPPSKGPSPSPAPPAWLVSSRLLDLVGYGISLFAVLLCVRRVAELMHGEAVALA